MANRAGRTRQQLAIVAVVASALLFVATLTLRAAPAGAAGAPGTISTINTLGAGKLAVSPAGDVYFAHGSYISRRTSAGVVSTLVQQTVGCTSGSYDPAAQFCQNTAVALGDGGEWYFAEGPITWFDGSISARIWRYDTPNPVLIAGSGPAGPPAGDGGLAINATIEEPDGLAVAPDGAVLFTDDDQLRRIDPNTGIVDTIAGTGVGGFSGDGGPATGAQVDNLKDVEVDSAGNIFIADASNFRVRKIDTAGIITTVAGNGTYGYSGDGGPALAAAVIPTSIGIDEHGNLYIAEIPNERIRMVNNLGEITTIAGTGNPATSGDGGPATEAEVHLPRDVGADGFGNVYLSQVGGIRRIESLTSGSTGGMVGRVTELDGTTGVAGVGVSVFAGWPSWQPAGTAVTGATGTYSVAGLAPGAYWVRFDDPAGTHPRTWYPGSATYAGASAVTVPAGSIGIAHQSLAADAGGLSGTVTEAGSATPLAGVPVRVYQGTEQVEQTTTAPDGTWTLPGLPPAADYRIRYLPDPAHLAEFHGDAASIHTATPVTVTASATTVVDDDLTATATVAALDGTVTEDGTGTPLESIAVTAYRNGTAVRTIRTAPDGTWTLAGLDPTGTWTLRYRDTDHSHGDEYHDNTPTAATATPIALTAGATTTIDAALTPTASLPGLTGTVVEDGTGTPLADIEVRLYLDGHTRAVTTTNPDGTWALPALFPTTYTLRFYDPGATHHWEFYNDQPGPGTATPLTLTTGTTTTDAALAPT